MAHATAGQHVGGGSRIADFWRISAVFDPIRGGPEPRAADRKTRAFFRLHDNRRPEPASRSGVQLAGKLSRFSPATNHGQRAGMFRAGIARRGPASLTGIKGGFKGQ